MKKIFKIASYDFRRLMLNPITLIVMAVVLVGVLILGATYKIPTTPAYTASTSGETTRQLYDNFNSANPALDTSNSLKKLITDAENILSVQSVQEECQDFSNLKEISDKFEEISFEIEKYKYDPQNSVYIENNNVDEIKLAANQLESFVTRYKNLEVFESKLFFAQEDFEALENSSKVFSNAVKLSSVTAVLDNLKENFQNFETLKTVANQKVHTWGIDASKLEEFKQKYIVVGKAKIKKISTEMERIVTNLSTGSISNFDDMKNLITSFKLTCESTKFGVVNELYLLLENHVGFDSHFKSIKNLYKYQPIAKEETTLALTKINYFLADESEYFTQHQMPLNFNTASYQVSFYDSTYFLMAIIGFFTILFGIFCAFKLFGLDRKNGKMDVILSQDVTFGQVFAGKFLAIILSTLYVLGVYLVFTLVWSLLFHPALANEILAVFNLSSPYTIHPLLFLLIKVLGIEFQVIFWAVITVFLMNLSRKFEIFFGVAVAIFAVVTICNIFLNGTLVYCLFPFIHADLTAFLGGGKMNAGFLQTPLYSYGNFFISLAYYVVVVALLYFFTKQLFKKN